MCARTRAHTSVCVRACMRVRARAHMCVRGFFVVACLAVTLMHTDKINVCTNCGTDTHLND